MTLADKTVGILEDLPPYLGGDRSVQAALDPVGRELARIEAAMLALREKMLPQNADDTYSTLPMWEMLLAMAVQPEGLTVDQRRARVLSRLRKRRSPASSDWVETVTTLIGTVWSWYLGPGPYNITIVVPAEGGTLTESEIVALLRSITPAHIDIHVTTGQGFLVGIGEVGVDAL